MDSEGEAMRARDSESDTDSDSDASTTAPSWDPTIRSKKARSGIIHRGDRDYPIDEEIIAVAESDGKGLARMPALQM